MAENFPNLQKSIDSQIEGQQTQAYATETVPTRINRSLKTSNKGNTLQSSQRKGILCAQRNGDTDDCRFLIRSYASEKIVAQHL